MSRVTHLQNDRQKRAHGLAGLLLGGLLLGGLAAALVAGPASAQDPPRQLSDMYLPIGQIQYLDFSPDGDYLIYQAYYDYRDYLDVYALPVGGAAGDEIFLGRRKGSQGTASGILAVGPDGSRVVVTRPDDRLVSVPITGGEEITLHDGLVFASGFDITADGTVVFTGRLSEEAQTHVYTVPITGGVAVQLSQLPGSGWNAGALEVSDDGSTVAYTGVLSRPVALFTVPITGGTATGISHQLQAGQRIDGFDFSPDGATVAYQVANSVTAHIWSNDLYSVPSGGGSAVMLHQGCGGSATAGFVRRLGVAYFYFTPDSSEILFVDSDPSETDFYRIESGGANKVFLDTQPLIDDFWWYPETGRLFYQWNMSNHSVGVLELGAGPGVLLSVGNAAFGAVVTPDLGHIVHRAFVETGSRLDVYSVPTDGGPPVRLNDPMASQENVARIAASSTRVVFEREAHLVSVPITGGVETFLTDTFNPFYPFFDRHLISPDGASVVYQARFESRDLSELYRVPIAGGRSEELTSPAPEVQGEVLDFVVGTGGVYAAYRADQDETDTFEVYETLISGSAETSGADTRVMNPPLGPNDSVRDGPVLAGAAATVLFEVDRHGVGEEVWATTFGGAPRLLFAADTVTRYEVVPPGHEILYLEDGELRSIAAASGESRSVENLVDPIVSFQLSADGSTVFLRSGDTYYRLPAVGGTPTALASDVSLIAPSPDRQWILFREVPSGDVLLVSSDGLDERDLGLAGAAALGWSADSHYLIYRPSGSGELWSYSLVAQTHQRLDAAASPPAGFFAWEWWPISDDQVIFSLTDDSSWARRLYRVSAAGGPVTPLLDAALEDRQVQEVHFGPDPEHLILDVSDALLGPSALYTVPVSGGASRALGGGEQQEYLGLTPDGQWVLYQDEASDFMARLYAEPVTGGPVLALTPEAFGKVEGDLDFGPGDRVTLRIARHQKRTELYTLSLGDFILFADGFESGDFGRWSVAVP